MTAADFATALAEDRRLTLLRVLHESTAYSTNEFVLQTMLSNFGHIVSVDRLHTDLAWLEEQALIAVDLVAGVRIAKLLSRGEDVALGRTIQPGVKRPRAG